MQSRIEANDLFDLAFVMEAYGERLSDDQIRWAGAYLADWERVRERYAKEFEQEKAFKDLTTVGETLARFRRATAEQRRRRWPQVQYQRIPIPIAVHGRVYAYQSREKVKSQKGTIPRQSAVFNRGTKPFSIRATSQTNPRNREEELDLSISR